MTREQELESKMQQTCIELHWAELRELPSLCESFVDDLLRNILHKLQRMWFKISQRDFGLAMEIDNLINLMSMQE